MCAFSADFIRPMTDRVKTSVFNTLYSRCGEMEGLRVLDLFSGTGGLALEALSRGAGEVYMVDASKKAVEIIKKNYKLLIPSGFNKNQQQVESVKPSTVVKHKQNCAKTPPGIIKIYQKDVFRFLSSYRGKSFDLIFADPPFNKYYGKKILSACASSQALGQGSLLVLEISAQEKIKGEDGAGVTGPLRKHTDTSRSGYKVASRKRRGKKHKAPDLRQTRAQLLGLEQGTEQENRCYTVWVKKNFGDKKVLFCAFS